MRIAVIGTGYVGLTTGVCFAGLGHQVTCVDIVKERVDAINQGQSPFYEPGLAEMLSAAVSGGRFKTTTDLAAAVAGSEITFITVGTPQSGDRIDLSFVAAAAKQIGAVLRNANSYHVVVVKSTVVPGTTDTLVKNALEESSGLSVGEFGLCMNPEFLREGSALNDFNNPDRIVVGQWDNRAGEVLGKLYESFECPKIFTTLRNAEMIKYASNSLLATLISFSNEIAGLCEATPGTDVHSVMEAVHLDRRLSPTVDGETVRPEILSFLRAGCGFGGSCLPKDVNALRAYARDHSITPRLLDAVVEVNSARPAQLVRMAEEAVGSLDGATVTVLGLAFKPDTDDLRQSPSLAVIKLLLEKGAVVKSYDPIFSSRPADLPASDKVSLSFTIEDSLRDTDAALIVTGWEEFARSDWNALGSLMKRRIIIDGRNLLRNLSWPAGTTYLPIGRSQTSRQPESGLEYADQIDRR